MDFKEMERILTTLKLALPKWAPSEINRELIAVWLVTLEDFSDEQIRAAFRTAVKTLGEWPSASIISRLCMGTIENNQQLGQETSVKIEAAIRRFGYTRYKEAMEYVGPVGEAVINQCGGWDAVCQITEDQMPSKLKQWRELATIYIERIFSSGSSLNYLKEASKEKNPLLTQALQIAAQSIK